MLLSRLARIEHGRLTLFTPGGSVLAFGHAGAEPAVSVAIHVPGWRGGSSSTARSGLPKPISTATGTARIWSALIRLAIANERALGLDEDGMLVAARAIERVRHALRRNSRRGSQRNIADHYDLGNAFYALWLDPGMTYSSAMFADAGDRPRRGAAARNTRRVAELLDSRRAANVLEIGCGWGGFAELRRTRARQPRRSASPCRTSSATYAATRWRERASRDASRNPAAGLSRRARQLRPHRLDRDDRGGGRAHWPTYFDRLRELLRPAASPCCRRSPSPTSVSSAIGAAPTSSSATSFRAACCPRPAS